MSIATLKKKTQTKYNNMSAGERQFSINGTRRSQGYVGQDTLGRSLPRTLMRGNVIRGHGGCCGKYPIQPIIQSSVTSTNDPNVVKSSVLGTSGMISTKYAWIERPQPYTRVKPDNNQNNNSQSDYITYVVDKTLNDTEYALSDELLVYPPFNQFEQKVAASNSYSDTLTNLSYGNGLYRTIAISSGATLTQFIGKGPFYTSYSNNDRYTRGTNSFQTLITIDGITYYGANWTDTRINSYIIGGGIIIGWWFDIELPYQISVEQFSFIPGIKANNIYELVLLGSNNSKSYSAGIIPSMPDTTPYWEIVGKANILDKSENTNRRVFFNTTNKKSFKIYRISVTLIHDMNTAPSVHGFQFHSYDKYYCQGEANYTSVTSCKKNTCTTNKPGINYNYAIPSGEYIRRLINCRTKDNHFYVASRNNKQPFTGFN